MNPIDKLKKIKKDGDLSLKRLSDWERFVYLSNVDEESGIGHLMTCEDLLSNGLIFTGNGNTLRKEHPIHTFFKLKTEKSGNAIISFQIIGYQTDVVDKSTTILLVENEISTKLFDNEIPQNIKKILKNKKCAHCDSTHASMEIDHKYGYKKLYLREDIKNNINSYQNICKSINDAKRQHCKECISSGYRFDARRLNYEIPFIYGSYVFDKTKENPCIGCYWADIPGFKKYQSYIVYEFANNNIQIEEINKIIKNTDIENVVLQNTEVEE